MRIALVTSGSRGDVQPFLALALGLQRAGHSVVLGAQDVFAEWIDAHGVERAPVHGDPRAIVDSPEGRALIRARHPAAFLRALDAIARPLLRGLMIDSQKIVAGADYVVYAFSALPAGYAADARGIPSTPVTLQPTTRSSAYPHLLLPIPSLGPLNGLKHVVVEQLFWHPLRKMINELRREILGMPQAPFFGDFSRFYGGREPVLCPISPSVVPRPADWPEWHLTPGYWTMPEPSSEAQPPAQLAAFLAAGSKPVYFGFGSMRDDDPDAVTALVAEVARDTGLRIVLHRGWAGLGAAALPPGVHLVDEVDHAWLFPRLAAVVHHAGAGTTASALRAGVPAVAVPFGVDQPFWARRIEALGVGVMLPRRRLSAARLAAALRRVTTDAAMTDRAAALGAQLRAEDGVATTVAWLERRVAGR